MDEGLIKFLADPGSYPNNPANVKHIETHISHVLLAGDLVYKIKKQVRFDFLDFSTIEKRKFFCEREVLLNRRFAPQIYIQVVPIYLLNGTYSFSAPGVVVEYAVKMRRFDDDSLFVDLLERGALSADLLRNVVRKIAAFHHHAEATPAMWGPAAVWNAIENTLKVLERHLEFLDAKFVSELRRTFESNSARLQPLIQSRQHLVKALHGDLHLRNIALFKGEPILFDGIEFNDQLSCCDVWADIGFLIMDLYYRKHPEFANLVMNTYLEESDDFEGLSLLNYYLSYRAAVRGKVNLLQLDGENDATRRASLAESGKQHVNLALSFFGERPLAVIAIGGLSGTGKTTISRELAQKIDAVHVRSDVVRKHLLGISPLERAPKESYTEEFSSTVYAEMRSRARLALNSGRPVILDAVHAEETERLAAEELAKSYGVPFHGFWCTIPLDEAVRRVRNRQGDASDADPTVVEAQFQRALVGNRWATLATSGDTCNILHGLINELVPGSVT